MSTRKQCVTCSKSGGIMTCDGCERTFCGKHVIEHRQELSNQLDGIMQEHDLLQQELGRPSDEHALLQKINQWEKESIEKIQVAATVARADVRELIEKSQKQLSKECSDIAANLRSSREADDFSENDLKRWMEQLEELKLEITSRSSVQLVEDEKTAFHLITLRQKTTRNKDFMSNEKELLLKNLSNLVPQERFSKVLGSVKLNDEGCAAVHTGPTLGIAYVLGQQLYSRGQQTVRFRIEKSKATYNIFFGCISSQTNQREIHFGSSNVLGWFGYNEVWQHGSVNRMPEVHGYNSNEIVINDVLHLTFNCKHKQIELFHERTKKQHILPVNMDKTPFPWQLFIALFYVNDCVRILL